MLRSALLLSRQRCGLGEGMITETPGFVEDNGAHSAKIFRDARSFRDHGTVSGHLLSQWSHKTLWLL
jgi:hypothetical protein